MLHKKERYTYTNRKVITKLDCNTIKNYLLTERHPESAYVSGRKRREEVGRGQKRKQKRCMVCGRK
jgi:hypothetical protein